jgi:hypothetical protein
MTPLEQALVDMFRVHKWTSIEWDGQELTCFNNDGEPWGQSEFIAGSWTDTLWEVILELAQDESPTKWVLSVNASTIDNRD